MEKWSAEQLHAPVSGSLLLEVLNAYLVNSLSLASLGSYISSSFFGHSLCLNFVLCVSQWTVAGAAGLSGAPAVEHVMLV